MKSFGMCWGGVYIAGYGAHVRGVARGVQRVFGHSPHSSCA